MISTVHISLLTGRWRNGCQVALASAKEGVHLKSSVWGVGKGLAEKAALLQSASAPAASSVASMKKVKKKATKRVFGVVVKSSLRIRTPSSCLKYCSIRLVFLLVHIHALRYSQTRPLQGSFAHQRRVASVSAPSTGTAAGAQQIPDTGNNGASLTTKPVEILIFYGPPSEAKAVRSLLQILDIPYPQVEISAGLYEYQAGTSTGSAVTAALKLFGSKLGISVGGGSTSTSGVSSGVSAVSTAATNVYNTLSFATPNFNAVLSLLDEDSHFRSVSRPKVLARSGQQVTFTTGQDVMVPGPITINASGQSLQSLINVTAGVTFQVTPLVRGDVVDVNLHETVSDFVPSPNANPSILKRDLVADLMMRPGVVYVIGGLNANSQTTSKQTFFGFKIGDQFTRNDTEILLLLTVRPDSTGI